MKLLHEIQYSFILFLIINAKEVALDNMAILCPTSIRQIKWANMELAHSSRFSAMSNAYLRKQRAGLPSGGEANANGGHITASISASLHALVTSTAKSFR